MSLTKKTINPDNVVVDGTPSKNHSVRIRMENLKLRDGHSNHKQD